MKRMKVSITIDIPNLEEVLRGARNKLDMSQNDLAHRVHSQGMRITAQNIQRVESGETKTLPYETLQKICDGLGLDLDKELREACQVQLPFLEAGDEK